MSVSPPVEAGAPGDPASGGTGLTGTQVAERIAAGQVNSVERASSRSTWQIIQANLLTRFNAILGALFVLVMVTGSFADGLFGVVLVVNSGIGITQETLAKRKLDRLALLNAPTTRVVRDGVLVQISTAGVVLGDLVELRSGDQVPADGHLHSAAGLEINESNLTGESDSTFKAAGADVKSGTTVVAGIGRFTAEAVGADSYANKISAQARKFTKTRSEIQESVNKLLTYITWVIVLALPLQIWSQYRVLGGQGWREVVIRSTGGLVGLVPEGLVLLTSVAFLLAAVQLTRQQVLVQELPAVEGLARVDVVCLDKTGTLTVGDIEFQELLPLTPPGQQAQDLLRAVLGALADDPNANGTLKAVAEANPAPTGWSREHGIAFNSARKYSAATFAGRGTWVLGAPEILLREGDLIREQVAALAATGQRVLLLSSTDRSLIGEQLPEQMVPAALIVLSEQVRPDAADTLKYFSSQGVAIKIISGDNPTTVAAIARRVGLRFDAAAVVDARTLGSDPEDLREVATRTTVFGRVSPEQKRALVQALQRNGHVVAMTGDGVNDVLALKDADIGIAMGNGAQATKAVAQLVLLDGSFSHLPAVLAQGRRVIGNVERVANLFLAKNMMSFFAILTAAGFALPFPFLPRQLTLVSALTIGIPAFFLALGPNTSRYLPGFLKRVLRFALPAGSIAGIVVIGAYLWARDRYGMSGSVRCSISGQTPAPVDVACWQPGTGATVALLTTFFWILVVLARPLRPWKAAVIGSMVAIGALSFLVPSAARFFNFNLPLGLFMESLIIGVAGAAAVEVLYRITPHRRNTTR
ncbi:cation-transporting ATPase E [Nakamurella sp. UYEF19]|uniref:HAD-IC family P-type ATPase n=1 Tax=Nakamurella sp. UYEF19 TaxID=1756392 RepID=UPI003390C1F6